MVLLNDDDGDSGDGDSDDDDDHDEEDGKGDDDDGVNGDHDDDDESLTRCSLAHSAALGRLWSGRSWRQCWRFWNQGTARTSFLAVLCHQGPVPRSPISLIPD